jgi:hypothetical protein
MINMKYLSDYMQERQTAAFDKAGAFFAFSREQFDKSKVEGVKYVNLDMGLICPKENAATLLKELDDIYRESIQQDIAENGLNAIIQRELSNHEAYYTRNIDSTVDALADYPVTFDDIMKVFKNKNHEVEKYQADVEPSK